MENKELNAAPASWNQLLQSAVSQPGKVLAAYSAFHNYSLGNQLLAMFQCEKRGLSLGPINTYKGWLAIGRQVRKGEKAIKLCMPITCKAKDDAGAGSPDTDGHCFTRFIYRNNWFVAAQTDGETAPAVATVPEWKLETALATLNITIEPFQSMNGNSQGYAKPGRIIAISPLAVLPHKTTFHELAHQVLGHLETETLSDDERPARNIREVEAESVAYLLVNVLGMAGAEYARGYIQNWLAGAEIPEKSAQRIFKAADTILKAGRPAKDDAGEVAA